MPRSPWFERRRFAVARTKLVHDGPSLIAGLPAVGLMILWAEHDGGYDQDTWYWGALVLLAMLAVCVVRGAPERQPAPILRAAIVLFALYVLWSYLSIAWAQAPGTALEGSNRALLYLIVFSLFVMLPWTASGALAILTTWAVGIAVVALLTTLHLASGDQLDGIFLARRLIAPTGYFNSSAALFTMAALVGTALSMRRELPAPIRGLLIAGACIEMQLALMGQSRGWLLTLPLVLLIALVVMRKRLRFVLAAVLPLMAAVIPVHLLLGVNNGADASSFEEAARHAGRIGLVTFAAALVLGTALAWGEKLLPTPQISARTTRAIGVLLVALTIVGLGAGVAAATDGHPVQFVTRQLNGFTNADTAGTGSHFATVGSGRYDFWRVALNAFLAHPVGGLGQDNFDNYYVMRRHTDEEPAWPHSLEMRLLACTGIIGFALFVGFLGVALWGPIRALAVGPALAANAPSSPRAGPDAESAPRPQSLLGPSVCAVALLPLVVWLVHGSVDWFWEMPALSAPALGFLGIAIVTGRTATPSPATPTPATGASVTAGPQDTHRIKSSARSVLTGTIGVIALLAATAALGFAYMSVREVSVASNVQSSDPGAALDSLRRAAEFNPLSATPDEMGGQIALVNGLFDQAQQFYQQAIDHDPDKWMNWFGIGLATSALGEPTVAAAQLRRALSINRQQEPAIGSALALVNTSHPLAPSRALSLIVAPH